MKIAIANKRNITPKPIIRVAEGPPLPIIEINHENPHINVQTNITGTYIR